MADLSFDVVIIGGGNKALVVAMYLTKFGGLSVGIFEERHELGGGWSCEEPVPGYIANTCSMAHLDNYHLPVYQDIPEWKDYGARYSHTGASVGIIYIEDHESLLFYNSFPDADPTQEKTAKQIAKYSERDAETWLWMWEKCEKYWRPAIDEWMWNPAQPFGKDDALDRLLRNRDAALDPLWLFQSPIQVYKDVFESFEMRHAFARVNQSWGFQTDMSGAGMGALLFIPYTFPIHCYVTGGSHQLAHASQRVILENGGRVFTKHPVKKIIIEGGNAKGIMLEDGTQIEAKHAVISSVDPYQLCFDLIGKEHLDFKILRRIENLERDWICITWYTWILKEPPRFIAEKNNPDLHICMATIMGDRDLDTFIVESAERKAGKWPSKCNTWSAYHGGSHDHMLGPEKKGTDFTVMTEQFVLPAYAMTDKEWKKMEKRHAEEIIETWQKYAPNMTWDNVIGFNPVTPYYTANMCKNFAPAGNWCVIDNIPSQFGRLRPIPEIADHRMPIKNLYGTGSAWHPYGSGHSIQGYNCYKVIAEDLGLKKPWEEKGRPY